jgi:hypothetical protein
MLLVIASHPQEPNKGNPMTQNIFAIENQESLNSLIHRPADNCPGDCEWCAKFHKAAKAVSAIKENNVIITLTANENVVVPKGYYNVWCEKCCDGENNTFYESCDWAQRHASGRHGSSK